MADHAHRPALGSRRDGVRHAAHEQDALGADRARRRHRHHVDRRHDVAHPRLRQLAARRDQPARSEHDHRAEVGRAQLRRPARASWKSRGGPTSRWRTRGRSSASARRSRWSTSGSARSATRSSRIYYGSERTKQVGVFGATENWAAVNFAKVELGRLFIPAEVEHRRQVVLLGNGPWQSLFPNIDPIGKTVRIGSQPVHGDRRARQAPEPGRVLDARSTTSRSSRTAPTRRSTARC